MAHDIILDLLLLGIIRIIRAGVSVVALVIFVYLDKSGRIKSAHIISTINAKRFEDMVYNIFVESLSAHPLKNSSQCVISQIAVLVAASWFIIAPCLFPGA